MQHIPFFRDREDTINVTRSHIKFFSFTLQELCMLATIIGQWLFFKVRLGNCRHALWQNGPKIDHQKFYWKWNRNLLKCKQNIYWYMYIIIDTLVPCSFMVNHWRYPGSLNIRTLSKNLGAGNDKPRFVTSLLQDYANSATTIGQWFFFWS